MTTVVNGVIKIGKTGCQNFEERMRFLENNGYANVVGLKRTFAIQVEDYDEKEKLLGVIFSKSRLSNTELFALDKDIVIQLLSSFDGVQIFPEDKNKKDIFEEVTKEIEDKNGLDKISNQKFYLKRIVKNFGEVSGKAYVKDGKFIVEKGSKCTGKFDKKSPMICKEAIIKNGILQADIVCDSPSTAGWVILGKSNNGWKEWKTKNGKSMEMFRIKN